MMEEMEVAQQDKDKDMESDDVPQSKPLPGRDDMVRDSAGGYVWRVDDMKRLRRFLCMGSEGGTYYIGEKQLGLENAQSIVRLIAEGRGPDVVKLIVEYSLEGRAAKQNPTIFALAMCARDKDEATKSAAYEALRKVCRIPTHLFAFVEFCESLSVGTGWGRAHRRAIERWYTEKQPLALANAVTKYRQRNGWSHLDVLRLAHPTTKKQGTACVFKYVVKGVDAMKAEFPLGKSEETDEVVAFLDAVELAKVACDEGTMLDLIKRFSLVREHVPTELLNSQAVS